MAERNMAKMTKRIIVCYISCIDVEIFSSIDNYIAYVGYPWQDSIDDENVYEEDGCLLNFNILDGYDLCYERSEIMIEDMKKSMKKYIEVFNLKMNSGETTADMIECIIGFRGITA